MKPITPASIRWSDRQEPVAADFDDCYFSRQDGLAETRHVFIDGNRLRQRWQALANKPGARDFVIAETGFGTGLNFIATWQEWNRSAPADARLLFVSAELHPLRADDLARCATLWPELAPLYNRLLEQYPVLTPGFHLLHFERVTLLLLLGDATEMFARLLETDYTGLIHEWRLPRAGNTVDAWFLDGFAPAKNPALWQAPLLHTAARLSKAGTTAATFSAAGEMRRTLQSVGFEVQKQKGYGNKRDMTCATFRELPVPTVGTYADRVPWHLSPSALPARDATVIGAGIAGCTLARALADKGFRVTVIEQQASPASVASGNRQAILYGKFSATGDAFAQFNLSSYLYALRFYAQLLQQEPALPIHRCGMLQLALDTKEQQLQHALIPFLAHYPQLALPVDCAHASELAGIAVESGGLFFPMAGWMHPAPVCTCLLQHPAIRLLPGKTVSSLQRQGDYWQLLENDIVIHESPLVIIANGQHCAQFSETVFLPVRWLRGQVTHVQATPGSKQLKTVLCGEGYIAPADGDFQSFGATYTPKEQQLVITADDHLTNWQHVQANSRALAAEWSPQDFNTDAASGRVQFRTATPDYLPLCGPVPVREDFLADYAALRRDASLTIAKTGSYQRGLYLCAGFGSRGMTWAPLCAEILAHQLAGLPSPVPRDISKALNPARFLIRDLMKNRI